MKNQLSVKEQRKILMDSGLVPGPKPYIQAAYDAKPIKKQHRKRTDIEKGAHEAYLFSLSKQGGVK